MKKFLQFFSVAIAAVVLVVSCNKDEESVASNFSEESVASNFSYEFAAGGVFFGDTIYIPIDTVVFPTTTDTTFVPADTIYRTDADAKEWVKTYFADRGMVIGNSYTYATVSEYQNQQDAVNNFYFYSAYPAYQYLTYLADEEGGKYDDAGTSSTAKVLASEIAANVGDSTVFRVKLVNAEGKLMAEYMYPEDKFINQVAAGSKPESYVPPVVEDTTTVDTTAVDTTGSKFLF